jgi:hypothetical protein
MNLLEVTKIFELVNRISTRLRDKASGGTSWSYTFPDGIQTHYILNNVKSPEELGDDIANLFI